MAAHLMTAKTASRVFKDRTFIVAIKIGQACGRLQFDAEQTRDQNIQAALERNNGRLGKDSIAIFEILDPASTAAKPKVLFSAQKAHTRMGSVLDELQQAHMIAGNGGEWYVPEANIKKLEEELQSKLTAEQVKLHDEFEIYYDEARTNYELALKDILAVNKQMDYLEYYLSKFPDMEAIKAGLIWSVERWEAQETLGEVMELADKDEAMKMRVKMIQAKVAEIQAKAPAIEDEVWECAAVALEDLEGYWDSSAKPRKRDRIMKNWDRIATLCNFWRTNFDMEFEWGEKVLDRIREIHESGYIGIHDDSASKALAKEFAAQIEEPLWAIRLELRESLPLAAGKGADRLRRWLYPESQLEAQITEIKAMIESGLEPDGSAIAPGDMDKLKAKLERLQAVLEVKLRHLLEGFDMPSSEIQPEKIQAEEKTAAIEIEPAPDDISFTDPEDDLEPGDYSHHCDRHQDDSEDEEIIAGF